MRYIKKYSDYKTINECSYLLPNNFMDYGYYDMANGQRDGVIDFLKENNISYIFDFNRNYIEVETHNTKELINKMNECDLVKIDFRYVSDKPDDCLWLKAPFHDAFI